MRRLNRTRIISESDKQLMLELKEIIKRFVPDAEVILYGSAARGARQPDSDYDVLILSPSKLTSEQQRTIDSAIYELDLEKDVVLSAVIYARDEWTHPIIQASPYRRNVMKDGVIV